MSRSIFGIAMEPTSYQDTTRQVIGWARGRESRGIYATSVHGIIEANDHADFKEILQRADLVTPDGMPMVWMLRLKGVQDQQRVYGPSLMLHVLEAAAEAHLPVGFYGGTPEALAALSDRMRTRFPGLGVRYAYSPPFRPLTTREDEAVVNKIIASGVRILFVGLGCPKQERWIDAHRGRIPAVMLAVGAAFDFHAGLKSQAPTWMQRLGLEWSFRLFHEPRRLWKRYLYNNPRFILLAVRELLQGRS